MKYTVWIKGYRATGEHQTARYLGTIEAANFKNAVKLTFILLKWDMNLYDEKQNTFWGCKFFDNETDARKNFG